MERGKNLEASPSPKESFGRSLSDGEGGRAANLFSASILTNQLHIHVQHGTTDNVVE